MSTHAEFHLRHEALEEARRLLAHPRDELVRLEEEAREGETAASVLIVVLAVFLGVGAIAALFYALVVLAAQLA